MIEWKDIKRKKPENGKQCLVAYTQKDGSKGYDIDFYDAQVISDFYTNRGCVTHWAYIDSPTSEQIDSIDRIMKVSLRLIDKYKNELYNEYGSDAESINNMFDILYKEQNKMMPLPWYEYGWALKASNAGD